MGARGALGAVLVLVAVVYAPVTSAWFCGYDDFHDLARAAYEFAPAPARVFTQPQGDGLRYRPLHPGTILATWKVAGLDARVYRVRNVAFHLASVALVYALGVMLLGARAPAAVAAGLFGLHPLANQAVNGAVWTNTMAWALALAGVVLALRGLAAPARGRLAIAAGGACALACALVYEPTAALLGLPWLAIVLGCPVAHGHARWLAGTHLVVVAVAAGLRLLALPASYGVAASSVPAPAIAVRNVAVSLAAPLLPLDPVLLAVVAGTPLPSEVDPARVRAWLPAGAAVAALAGVLALAAFRAGRRRRARPLAPDERARARDGVQVALLAGAGALLPLVLIFAVTDHPSETYLYGPCAFVMLAAVALVRGRFGARRPALCAVLALAVAASFTLATTVRNRRVLACGRVAARIVAGLPAAARTAGVPVVFANAPEEPRTTRYGLYGYHGVHTIGHGAMADRGVSAALQLVYGDWRRAAVVRAAPTLAALCAGAAPGELRVWVHPDGRVETCGSRSASRP